MDLQQKFKCSISQIIIAHLIIINQLDAQPVNHGVDIQSYSTNYYSIPFIDLNDREDIQYVVDKDPTQYLGHPTTHLLDDGKTILCVYPKGHGKGDIVYKKSVDGGINWSQRINVPASWATSLEVPTLFPVEDASGKKRLILFSGLYPTRMAISENNGESWSELDKVGDWGGIVVMGDLMELNTGKGHYMAMFHDDGRYFSHMGRTVEANIKSQHNQSKFILYKTFSYDGGLTWSFPESIFENRIIHLCEPGFVRSPDGNQIAVLLRENSRRMNSHIIFSDDEGKNWSNPKELPNALTGDRHQAIYMDDGRLFISFRDNSPALSRFNQLKSSCVDCDEKYLYEKAGPVSPTAGDWVAWVGTYEDLVKGQEGQLRIRLKDNHRGSDCAYPALEKLPDGTLVATTYGYWEADHPPYVLAIRIGKEDLAK